MRRNQDSEKLLERSSSLPEIIHIDLKTVLYWMDN